MTVNEVKEKILQIKSELQTVAKRYNYDFQNEFILKKSVELDKALNLYNLIANKSKHREAR